MSEERAQISMSNTKKEMLETCQALLARGADEELREPEGGAEADRAKKRSSLRLRLSPLRRWISCNA